jgi:hypothetical protein
MSFCGEDDLMRDEINGVPEKKRKAEMGKGDY